MPLDKFPVIDKSVFPLRVTCVAVALGNASILRTRSEFILGKPAFLLPGFLAFPMHSFCCPHSVW